MDTIMQSDQSPASNSPRKFSIRSNFGRARQPRSRKNRPCDVCRKRKTACVIAKEPPCVFCKSRGLACQSIGETRAVGESESIDCPTQNLPVASSSPTAIVAASLPQDAVSAAVVHHGLVQSSAAPGLEDSTQDPSAEAIQSLEDVPDRTAHSMGLAAEQDPYFLAAFRSVLLSERDEVDAKYVQVHDGGLDADDHPIHFVLLQDEFPAHTNDALREVSDAIEALVWPHGPALVRLYFRHVHPALPIVSKCRFLRQYHTAKEKLPASLRGAIYALACIFWGRDETLPAPRPFEQHQLVTSAHASLRRELEAPNLYKLQACLLLMHTLPPEIDSVETPSVWILAAQATACAQMIGLHQDPSKWSIPAWEKKARKKLWWAVYMTDCWSAVCHGNPSHIASGSFSTPPPDLEDLRFDEDIPEELHYLVDFRDVAFRVADGARFLEMVRIARDLRAILDCSCQVNATAQSRSHLVAIRERLKEWPSLVPSCLAVRVFENNGPLHLSYYATQALLFRGLMYPASGAAKATPGSNLRQWLSTALTEFESFTTFMNITTQEELTGFWVRHSRSQLILCGNFLIYLFLLATEPRDIEAAYRLLESFHQSLQRLGTTDHLAARLLLRPAMLRIESFFAQAAELITHARTVDHTSPAMSS